MPVSLTKVTTINLTFTEEVTVWVEGRWVVTTELKGCQVLARTADRITVQYGANLLHVPLSDLVTEAATSMHHLYPIRDAVVGDVAACGWTKVTPGKAAPGTFLECPVCLDILWGDTDH